MGVLKKILGKSKEQTIFKQDTITNVSPYFIKIFNRLNDIKNLQVQAQVVQRLMYSEYTLILVEE